jgi:hypothetical protein
VISAKRNAQQPDQPAGHARHDKAQRRAAEKILQERNAG